MARTLKEAHLTTKSARSALPSGVHWRRIDTDIHLGYRKGVRGGRWLVRWSVEGRYRKATLGNADDILSEGNYSFDAASRLARDYVGKARIQNLPDQTSATVQMAVESYVAIRDARTSKLEGRTMRSDAASRMSRYVLADAKFVARPLASLTEAHLAQWRSTVPSTLKGTTRRRLFNDLKAALNAAGRQYRKQLPADFEQTVRYGLSSEDALAESDPPARDNQILGDETVRKIIVEAFAYDDDGDVGRMVLLLAATGARFSQLRRMLVRDVQEEHSRLMVPSSRKGRSRTPGYATVRVGRDVIDALRPVLDGREATEPLLARWRHIQTKKLEWVRVGRRAWSTASELTRPWKTICGNLKLTGIVPYALRHSSIVRSIRAGLPIRLVASSHDTSVLMIERHYSRWITDGLEEMSAKAIVPLVNVA